MIDIKRNRRIICIFCVLLMLFSLNIFKIYSINVSDSLVATAGVQGRYKMEIASTRGVIYDTGMNKLVGTKYRYLASVRPTIEATNALVDTAESEEEREAIIRRMSSAQPFVLGLSSNSISADGIDVFRVPVRYGDADEQLAPHVIGYLSGDGQNGVSGIEKAYNDFLRDTGTSLTMKYQTDAVGRVMQGGAAGVERVGGEDPVGGVVLTIDRDIQRITQRALSSGCDKGAAVVMDIYSGDILAMFSHPSFDQNNITASFDSEEAPFINRAVSGYNIGSVFKLVISAAALESGLDEGFRHICTGKTEINGITFRCNNHSIHGEIDMERALQVSCNTYFIALAQQLDPGFVLSMTRNLGLGSSIELASGMNTQAGNLPEESELKNEAAYANFSFGQGSSLASPLQIAQMISSMANTGLGVTPRLVKGFTLDGVELAEQTPVFSANQVISQRTAKTMQKLMASVVDNGSGRTANPYQGGAGGKTSSAQTGIYNGDEEIVHAWFAGYYPQAAPKYSIVVFVEGGESGEKAAAPIFRQIADGINGLKGL